METPSVIILSCIGVYSVLCLGVGLWAARRTHSKSDFYLAGRSLGPLVTGVAIFSSTLSGMAFVGGPGLVYRMGMSSLWIVVTSMISTLLGLLLVAKPLRMLSGRDNALTIPEAIQARYSDASLRWMTASVIIIGVLAYLAIQIKAMATVLDSLLTEAGFGWSPSVEGCVAISTAVLVTYCVLGGIVASVYTDLFQGAVMLVGTVIVFIVATTSFEGGLVGMSEVLIADDRESIGPFGVRDSLGVMTWFFVFSLGACGQPHVVSKYMMIRDVRSLRSVMPVVLFSGAVASLLWISVGLFMRASVIAGTHADLPAADAAAPLFLQNVTGPWVAGLLFAGLFAAIMSTADSFLNIGSAALIHDIPGAFGRSLGESLWAARISTVLLALFAAWIAVRWEDLLALLGVVAWGVFAAALVPIIAFGFHRKRPCARAAKVAIGASLVVSFGLELTEIKMPHSIDRGALALILSCLLFLVLSSVSRTEEAVR